ncbi:MAG: FkbM family methyltransferase [Bacteroidales bacterium]|nr:FkbM family methyltransferase [Bacteroidales bacterium]
MNKKIKKIIPVFIKDFIKKIVYNKYKLTYYHSQIGEDILLNRIFEKKIKNGEMGFFVDVGAYHPYHLSNTYFFYKNGWRGINIEPRPGSAKFFNKERPRDINLELAISDKKETLKYYMFKSKYSIVNTFCIEDTEEVNLNVRKYNRKVIEIQTYPLSEVLDKYLPSGQEIDFLSIDVEGLDFNVLRSNNWKKYRPKILLVELYAKNIDEIKNHQIYLYLANLNYKFLDKLDIHINEDPSMDSVFNCFFFDNNYKYEEIIENK